MRTGYELFKTIGESGKPTEILFGIKPGPQDRRVLACNYLEATPVCAKGARAYLFMIPNTRGKPRLYILARSRSGRWVLRYEPIRRLGNFRLKTMPPEHPLYDSAASNADERTLATVQYLAKHGWVSGRSIEECREELNSLPPAHTYAQVARRTGSSSEEPEESQSS